MSDKKNFKFGRQLNVHCIALYSTLYEKIFAAPFQQ